MADLQATPIKNKFIFTNEGRRMLTAQLNGIRFAILGAILVQGIEPIELTDEDKQRNPIDDEGHSTSPFYNTMRTLNLEELINTPGVMIGIKDVDYIAQGNQRIGVDDLNAYHDILDNIEKHLLPIYYIPSQELQDNYGNIYGTYNFEFDRTTISVAWPGTDDDMAVSFAHICLIGKQYAETNDATFNVNLTQRPVIVGVAQLEGDYDPITKTVCYDNIEIPTVILMRLKSNKPSNMASGATYNDLGVAVESSAKAIMDAMNRRGIAVDRVTIGEGCNDLKSYLSQKYKVVEKQDMAVHRDYYGYTDSKVAQFEVKNIYGDSEIEYEDSELTK